jgi:hypothetical protein
MHNPFISWSTETIQKFSNYLKCWRNGYQSLGRRWGWLVNSPAASIELWVIHTEYIHCQPTAWLIGNWIDYSNPVQLINWIRTPQARPPVRRISPANPAASQAIWISTEFRFEGMLVYDLSDSKFDGWTHWMSKQVDELDGRRLN